MTANLHITGDETADALLSSDPLSLLVGMLLDQQVPMETAFAGPAKLLERLQGSGAHKLDAHKPDAHKLDAQQLADYDADEFEAIFRITPSIHRYPGSMAGRTQALAASIVENWDGDAAAIWTRGNPDGAEILKRLKALPGFGEQKAKIFLALLGKQYGLTASGWRGAAGDYGIEGSHRSVADIVDPESLTKVREFKKAAKAAAKK